MTNEDLKIRVAVLEKMVETLISSVALARVAEKTADKALQMAQEALVIVTSAMKAQEQAAPPVDPMGFDDGLAANVDFSTPASPSGGLAGYMAKRGKPPTDEQLNGEFEKVSEDA